MLKSILIVGFWTFAASAMALGEHEAARHARRYDHQHDHHSQTLVTVTVDWLPIPGSSTSESTVPSDQVSTWEYGEPSGKETKVV